MNEAICAGGNTAIIDPLGYWVCRTSGCVDLGAVLRPATERELASACRCGRLVTNPIHDPLSGGSFEEYRPR